MLKKLMKILTNIARLYKTEVKNGPIRIIFSVKGQLLELSRLGGGVDPSASPSWSSGPPHYRSSLHPSAADQRERRSAALTGSSQRDIGVSVVCVCWHVKRWFVL